LLLPPNVAKRAHTSAEASSDKVLLIVEEMGYFYGKGSMESIYKIL